MAFDPQAHLIQIQGKDYLLVQWRLKWFREDYPHGKVVTDELAVDMDLGYARYRATVEDGEGGLATGIGTAYKDKLNERLKHYFVEIAETSAVGRALAMLGYGTQFVGDELEDGRNVVDSPTRPRPAAKSATLPSAEQDMLLHAIDQLLQPAFRWDLPGEKEKGAKLIRTTFGVGHKALKTLPLEQLQVGYATLVKELAPTDLDDDPTDADPEMPLEPIVETADNGASSSIAERLEVSEYTDKDKTRQVASNQDTSVDMPVNSPDVPAVETSPASLEAQAVTPTMSKVGVDTLLALAEDIGHETLVEVQEVLARYPTGLPVSVYETMKTRLRQRQGPQAKAANRRS